MDFNVVQSYILKLPSFDDLKNVPKIKELIKQYSEEIVEEYLQDIINKRHKKIVAASNIEEIKNLDYSFDFYIEKLKENIITEKGRPLKKVLNCLGTIYSQYIGDRIYGEGLMKDFEAVFTGYNNLEFDEEKGERTELDDEIQSLFSQIIKGKDFIILNNISSALYLVVDTLYKEENVVMSLSDTVYLPEKIGLQDVVKKAGGSLKIAGYLNKIDIEDYEDVISDNKNLIIYSNIFENSLTGIKKADISEVCKLKSKAEIIYISNKVYYQTDSDEIKNIGENFFDVINNGADLKLIDFSKLAGGPELGILAGDKKLIEKIKKNNLYKIFSPNKETKTMFYLTLKIYLEKKYSSMYINKCFSITDEEIKKRNRKFLRNLEREIGEYAELGFVNGNYFILDDKKAENYSFLREAVFIKPLFEEAEQLEKKLRTNNTSILCWVNKEGVIINLQLLSEEEEEIIIEILSKRIFKKNIDI